MSEATQLNRREETYIVVTLGATSVLANFCIRMCLEELLLRDPTKSIQSAADWLSSEKGIHTPIFIQRVNRSSQTHHTGFIIRTFLVNSVHTKL